MVSIYLAVVGLIAFVVGVTGLGVWIRMQPTKAVAEKTSRIAHSLFFLCLGTPVLVSLFIPGLTHLDELVGLGPLPLKVLRHVTGIALLIPGAYLMGASNVALRALGSGANAFRLTQQTVHANVYEYTRNPMSLGYYLLCIAIGLLSGSTALTLYLVLGIIPAHLFFLVFFEARELELRLGESYRAYRDRVPFLLPTRIGRHRGSVSGN